MGLFRHYTVTPWRTQVAWIPVRLTVSGRWAWLTRYCTVGLVDDATGTVLKTWRCLPQNRADVNVLISLEIHWLEAPRAR